MTLSRTMVIVMSVWTFYMHVDGEVTNIRKCSHGSLRAPGNDRNSYSFSVSLFCSQDCQISNVTTSLILPKSNCSVPTTIDRTQTDVQARNCGGPEECTEMDLATQDKICNISIAAHFSVVILYNCSTHEENATSFNLVSTETTMSSNKIVTRSATSSQSMISAAGAREFNSSMDYKDRGASAVVIALSVIICVLLIVVIVVTVCMCSLKKRLSKFERSITEDATPENYDRLENIHQPRAIVIPDDNYLTPISEFERHIAVEAAPDNYDRPKNIHQPRAGVIQDDDYLTPV